MKLAHVQTGARNACVCVWRYFGIADEKCSSHVFLLLVANDMYVFVKIIDTPEQNPPPPTNLKQIVFASVRKTSRQQMMTLCQISNSSTCNKGHNQPSQTPLTTEFAQTSGIMLKFSEASLSTLVNLREHRTNCEPRQHSVSLWSKRAVQTESVLSMTVSISSWSRLNTTRHGYNIDSSIKCADWCATTFEKLRAKSWVETKGLEAFSLSD